MSANAIICPTSCCGTRCVMSVVEAVRVTAALNTMGAIATTNHSREGDIAHSTLPTAMPPKPSEVSAASDRKRVSTGTRAPYAML
eukprot:CAMPEP_0114260206 /NCGR_PEP_ID=MMETSP0058-20121206/20343_1 /TAXON_ID=36894 /ORGANISM="Pyramimonas parkeae, CCMP726" /LENGTH=84 /DNA_ID=CAMNT_0001375385 /DNA_START=338 /DNA_END=592 /DNA_ORIENTATION=-